MVEGLVKGKFKGVMADHEVERFRIWEGMGEEMVVSCAFLSGWLVLEQMGSGGCVTGRAVCGRLQDLGCQLRKMS